MILTRLYESGEEGETTRRPGLRRTSQSLSSSIWGADGQFLGVSERRGESVAPSKKKGVEAKKKPDSRATHLCAPLDGKLRQSGCRSILRRQGPSRRTDDL